MVKRRGSFPFWDAGLPFQVLLLLFSGRVLSTKRSIISHPFLAPAWVDDFPKLPVWWDMDVSKNNGTPKSSILIGFSIINHPFWGTPIFGSTPICFCWQGSTSPWRIESPSPEMLHDSRPPQQWRVLELETAMLPWEAKIPSWTPLANVFGGPISNSKRVHSTYNLQSQMTRLFWFF